MEIQMSKLNLMPHNELYALEVKFMIEFYLQRCKLFSISKGNLNINSCLHLVSELQQQEHFKFICSSWNEILLSDKHNMEIYKAINLFQILLHSYPCCKKWKYHIYRRMLLEKLITPIKIKSKWICAFYWCSFEQ